MPGASVALPGASPKRFFVLSFHPWHAKNFRLATSKEGVIKPIDLVLSFHQRSPSLHQVHSVHFTFKVGSSRQDFLQRCVHHCWLWGNLLSLGGCHITCVKILLPDTSQQCPMRPNQLLVSKIWILSQLYPSFIESFLASLSFVLCFC